QRSWDRGRDALAQPDLFARHPEFRSRTFRATSSAEPGFIQGETLILEPCDGRVLLFRGRSAVGTMESPPQGLLEAIRTAGCGVATGVVERVRPLSGDADISVR